MEYRDMVLKLCNEMKGSGPDNELVEGWENDHACCCWLHADKAAQGDRLALNNIRRCMGLPLEE